MGICVSNKHTTSNLHIVTDSGTFVNPLPCTTHSYIVANGKCRSWFYVYISLQIACYRIHTISRGEIEIISYRNPRTPRISHDTLPGIWRFLPNTTPCDFNIIRLIRGYNLMRSAVGRLKSFRRNYFSIIYNLYIRVS